MEMNQNIIEKLKSQAKELGDFQFGDVIGCIDELLKHSAEDTIYKIQVNGEELYSFMSEEEMYQTMFGKTKADFLKEKEEREKSRQEEKIKEKAKCEEALKTKFPKYKKLVRESFPKQIAEEKIERMKQQLENGRWFIAKDIETWINILEAVKTKPMREVQKMYYQISSDPQNRLTTVSSLAGSFYSDIFMNLIVEDSLAIRKNDRGELSDEVISEVVSYYKKMAQDAKSEADVFFQKQDAMAELKSRLRKPIEKERAQKASNDLEAVLGASEDSQKGKTTSGKQKD